MIAKHESLNPARWHRFKEDWLVAIAATPDVIPAALRLVAVLLAEVGDKTHEHSGKRYTRGVVKVPVEKTLERLGMDDTDTNRRKIRRGNQWLKQHGFLIEYQHGIGGAGRRRRVPSYVLSLPEGGHSMSTSNEMDTACPPSEVGGHSMSPSNEADTLCPDNASGWTPDVREHEQVGGHSMSATDGHSMSPSFDYGATMGSNTTGSCYESARTHARGALTASEVRKREQEAPGELWWLAEAHDVKPNPMLNMWVRHVGADTPVDDPLGSFRAYLESVAPLAA